MTLKELYVEVIALIHEGEDVKGGFTFVDSRYLAAHCNREHASEAFGCQVGDAEHYFSVIIEEIVSAFKTETMPEYSWIEYIPTLFGVDDGDQEEFVAYVAIHEAAHMIETEYGFPAPSAHDEVYEAILIDLMTKYWRLI